MSTAYRFTGKSLSSSMIPWIPYTFVRTVLFFIGGILLASYDPELIPQPVSWTLLLVLTVIYLFLALSGRKLRRSFNPGRVALPLVFLMGYINLVTHTESRETNHVVNHRDTIRFYRVVVTRFPEEKARTWKIEARITHVKDDRWKQKYGNVILYFSKSDFPQPFRYGDVLLVQGQPQIPEGPSNPGEFDYREYLKLRNIYHQHFIRAGEAYKYDHDPPNIVTDLAYAARQWSELTLHRFIEGDRERAIASALVLGVTDGLDNELLSAYAATGTMHILAVSGLHISILYFILLWMLSPLNKIPRGRWLTAFIALTTLWLYAIVTGLSPSVLRAVGMFSFLAVARPWAKSTNIYNTLAVSALCLLLFDPFLLRSVGFQLSYMAVLGIVYLYPRILRIWEPEHRVTVEIWKLSAVSISAQIATFPLGLLYFHQFPNYFLVSNLLVVPLSFVVLIVGLLIVALAFVPVVASVLGFCLEYIIRFLNAIVFTLEDLPFSMITDVYISSWQCALLMLLIGILICLWEYRKFSFVISAFLLILCFSLLQWLHFFRDIDTRTFAVYKIPGHTAIDLMESGRTHFISDTALVSNGQKLAYHVKPHRQMRGVRWEGSQTRDITFDGGKLIIWKGVKILYLANPGFKLPTPLTIDWIVVANNSLANPQSLQTGTVFKKIILDSSNSFFFASRFLEEAKLYKLEVHSVLHQGAFISKIEQDIHGLY